MKGLETSQVPLVVMMACGQKSVSRKMLELFIFPREKMKRRWKRKEIKRAECNEG